MPFATSIENSILDHFTGKASWTAPAAVYVGFSSTQPTKSGTNVTEPSTGAYVREQVTSAQWTSAASGATETNADKTFTTATADWLAGADLGYIVFYTASTAGTFLGYATADTARNVLNGETAKILAGELDLAFAA